MRYLLIKIDPTLNMKRYYLICVQPTLLGEHCVVRIHGRIGYSERILPPLPYESAEAAQGAAEQLGKRKRKRGYAEDGQQQEGATNHDDSGATDTTPCADIPSSGA